MGSRTLPSHESQEASAAGDSWCSPCAWSVRSDQAGDRKRRRCSPCAWSVKRKFVPVGRLRRRRESRKRPWGMDGCHAESNAVRLWRNLRRQKKPDTHRKIGRVAKSGGGIHPDVSIRHDVPPSPVLHGVRKRGFCPNPILYLIPFLFPPRHPGHSSAFPGESPLGNSSPLPGAGPLFPDVPGLFRRG